MPRSRRALVAALVVVLVGAGAVVAVAAHHGAKHRNSGGGTENPTGPTGTLDTKPVSGLTADQFGISTGVQLFNEKVDKIDEDMAAFAAMPTHWVRTAVRWDLIEPTSAEADDWTK